MIINDKGPANVPETTTDRFLAGKNNLQSFLDEVELPKEEFQIPETPNIQDTHTDSGGKSDTDSPPVDAAAKARSAKATAKFLCTAIDSTFAGVASFIALIDDISKFKATDEEKNDLIEAWFEYLKTVDYNIPPSMMVLLMIFIVYGTKIPVISKERKINKKALEAEKEAKKVDEKAESTEEVKKDDKK